MKNCITKLFKKSPTPKLVAVGIPVIIQNKKGEILLGKRNDKVQTFPNTWGLPGGLVDYGETVKEAAKREIKEELNVEIKITKMSSNIYDVLPSKECKFHAVNPVCYAKIIKGKPTPEDETKEIKYFKPSEIRKMKLAYTHKEILKKEKLI